jgi:hypothetical protein
MYCKRNAKLKDLKNKDFQAACLFKQQQQQLLLPLPRTLQHPCCRILAAAITSHPSQAITKNLGASRATRVIGTAAAATTAAKVGTALGSVKC